MRAWIIVLATFALTGCEDLLFDHPDGPVRGADYPPAWVGQYNGSVDMIRHFYGVTHPSLSSVMHVQYQGDGRVTASVSAGGRTLVVRDCYPGFSSLNCDYQAGGHLVGASVSFSGTQATAQFVSYRQESNGTYTALETLRGTFTRR